MKGRQESECQGSEGRAREQVKEGKKQKPVDREHLKVLLTAVGRTALCVFIC